MVRRHGEREAEDMDETPDTPTPPTGEQSGTRTFPGGPPGPDPAPDPQAGPRTSWDEVKNVQGLRRPAHDRMVAGVAAGLARHLNIDPLVLRVAFVVLSLFGGVGVILYGALWLLLPEDGKPEAPVNLDERSRGVALIGVLALAVLAVVGDSWGFYSFPWPLALLAVVVWFVWSKNRSSGAASPSTPTASPYAAPYAGPYAGPAAPATPYAGPTAPYAAPHAAGHTAPYESGPAQGWTPPPGSVQSPPLTRPRDPRKRGPILFWFTLALIALALGVLGTVDLAGASVADSAYPALAMTISAAMLVLGAFWGRAGGIILIALIAAITTVGALAAENWQQDERLNFTPLSAGEVRENYEMHRGELVLDLTEVTDPDALNDREIRIDGGAGRIEVRLPEGLGYNIDAEIGVGSIRLPEQGENGGLGISATASSEPSEGKPRVTIATDMGVGEIVVTQIVVTQP